MEQFLAYPLRMIPYVAITLIFAFTFHEFAHAFVAYKFGDDTAKKQGRLTLNPLKHLDPFGTILILIAGFGWARPVPVNRFFFKKPRLASILVSVSGPLANLILAAIGYIVVYGLSRVGVVPSDNFSEFLYIFVYLNVVLFIFNLIPLPPLDGYRIVEDLAPNDVRAKMTQFEQYGTLIFLILVITPLNNFTIQPIFNVAIPWVMEGLKNFFSSLLL